MTDHANSTKPIGPATPEQLHELHRLLASALVAQLKDTRKPSAEVLGVARSLLKDNGLFGLAQTEADRRTLRRLWGLLVRHLSTAMQGNPKPALVAEVRLFLAANGVTKDLPGHAAKAQALHLLADASLPFTKH